MSHPSSTAPTMTEFTQSYLGNTQEQQDLKQKLLTAQKQHQVLEVFLHPQEQKKARIFTQSVVGQSIAIIKDRHWSLRDGDLFSTISGKYILIHLKPLEVLVLKVTSDKFHNNGKANSVAIDWFRLGHHLGNLHYPVNIEENQILVLYSGDREKLVSVFEQFEIPGLEASFETRIVSSMDIEQSQFHREHSHAP